MIKKSSLSIGLSAALSCLTLQGAAIEAFAQPGATKIGAFVRGASEGGSADRAFEQGMQLAAESKSPPVLSIQAFDSSKGTSPDSAELKKLVEADKVPLIVFWDVDDLSPVAPSLQQAGVVGLVSWDVNKQIRRIGTNMYGFGYSTEASFEALAKFAGNTLKSYRFCLITSPAEPFATHAKAFSEQTKSLGNTVVFDEKADPAGADFAPLIARAQKETCDTIFASLPAPALVSFIKAARASFKGKLLAGDSLTAEDIASLGKDAEGIHMVQAWSDDAALKARYAAKFGSEPDGITLGSVATGYDAIACIQEMGRPLDAGAIKNSLLSTPCEGLTGKTQFTGERIAQRTKRILTVKEGKLALAQ